VTHSLLDDDITGPFVQHLGLDLTEVSGDRVVATWVARPDLHQPYGIVHGGVHCGLIESLASIGAALYALPRGQSVVGLENNTSFVRAVRAGARLHAVATPVTRGRRTQVWEAQVLDHEDKLVATGRVRLLCLESDQQLAGEQVKTPLHPRT